MGGPNKLLAEIGGKSLVRLAAEQALASQADARHRGDRSSGRRVEAALKGLDVTLVHNPDFADGLSTSLKTGLSAVPARTSMRRIVLLADMPQVDAALIDRLIGAFDPERGALVVVPTIDGKRGNPVLWSRRFFPELMALEGDVGARHLIGSHPEAVTEVPVRGQAALMDVDTPDALIAVKAELEAR